MKKIIAVILALVFMLSLFAGCNKTPKDTQLPPENPPKSEEKTDGEENKNETPDEDKEDNEEDNEVTDDIKKPEITEVTDENVKELFSPTLEVYVCFAGSGLYELEKNDDGTSKTYGKIEGGETKYKVIGYDDPNKIESDYRKYVSEDADAYGSFPSGCFIKDGGDLYVTDGAIGSFGCDKNSIRLEKYENGKYYISVDRYFIDPLNFNDVEPFCNGSTVFTVSIKGENLYIEAKANSIETNYDIPALEEIDLVYTYTKY